MKITMMKVLNIREELDALFTKDIPIKASWKISKFIRQIENEYNDFQRNRTKIQDKYIDKTIGKVPDDKLELFRNDIEDLLDVEVELNVEPIDIKELGDVSMPPLALAKMAFMFSETIEEPIPDIENNE